MSVNYFKSKKIGVTAINIFLLGVLILPIISYAQYEIVNDLLGIPGNQNDVYVPVSAPVSSPPDPYVPPSPNIELDLVDFSGVSQDTVGSFFNSAQIPASQQSPSINPSAGSGALNPLIQCDGSTGNPCNFSALIGTINRIINWIISIAVVIFTISLIYGGFLYIRSGDNPSNKEKAKSILWSTFTGFVIILVAWLIVYTILVNLVPSGSSIFRFIGNK